jgi:hypothetical protein
VGIVADVTVGERQQAERALPQRFVERLLEFAAQHYRRDRHAAEPEHQHARAQPDGELQRHRPPLHVSIL